MTDEERLPEAVIAFHVASQNLADTLGEHLTVKIDAPSFTAILARIYHPPTCDKHLEWRKVEGLDEPPKPTPIPEAFKDIFS